MMVGDAQPIYLMMKTMRNNRLKMIDCLKSISLLICFFFKFQTTQTIQMIALYSAKLDFQQE